MDRDGVISWRAGCAERCKSGSEGGPGKRTGRKLDTAPRSDPYTEHPTREGKIYCCAVIDAFSRMVVGWSIDSRQTGLLVANALGMALNRRAPREVGIIHSDQGVQFASWVFSQKVTEAGLAPSVGAVGAPFDNAMVEAFWARMQVELLNRRRWKTRVELASAIHDYIEIWHNTKRRHSALNMLTPSEYENQHKQQTIAA
jgi:putative transposase